jgi:hypothetical protein
MPLLDLKTDLKSLKYGKDRPGGGDSGQPYQKVDINTVDSGFNRFRMTKFDDGLVRGGVVGAANASIVDTLRIGKFLTDFPKGPLFIVKQIGLQLSNPQLETKKLNTNNPTKGGGLLRNVGNFIINTANKIVNAVGPTRIYNLGINTLAQVPVNAFGQHFNRHGLLPVQDDQTKYLAVAQNNNNEENNRLTGLRNRFGLGVNYDLYKGNIKLRKKEQKTLSAIAATFAGGIPFANSVYNDIQNSRIADYIGGPSSVYGIGRTLIPRTPERTNDNLKVDYAKNRNYNSQYIPEVKISSSFDFEISNRTNSALASSSFNLIKDTGLKVNGSFISNTYKEYQEKKKDNIVIVNNDLGVSNNTSSSLNPSNKFKLPQPTSLINNFVTYDGGKPEGGLTASADLGLTNLSIPIGFTGPIGSPTTTTTYDIPKDIDAINKSLNQNAIPYTTPALKKYAELRKKVNEGTSIDKTYITEISRQGGSKTETFKTFNVNISRNDPSLIYNRLTKLAFRRTNDTNVNDDKLALKFVPLDPFTGKALNPTLNFLGYITDYSENYDSSWGDVKYAGRNEKFYIFNDFKRTATVGFNIPCFNPDELEQKHCDMSELASVLAGKYQDNLLLGGIITRLKVGRYINDQPGIITNLNFSPIEGSSWDLDRGLAFYLKVSFGFTLIHNFLPQYGKCGFIDRQPDPIPETVPEETDTTPEEDDRRTTTTITIEDIPPTRIDNTRNANLEATRQRAEFEKNKILPQTKAQTDAARKLLNSLPSSN